jgi:hypothetical protein
MTRQEFHDYRTRVMARKPDWTQFNRCQAWVSDGYFGVKLVKSYSTIVGVIKDDTLWWDRKYSRTTSKQITQIANKYNLNTAQVEDV